eukprot:augustus_masked-scaffold_3-processed-gene-21.97-mRNA-1 protein AED:0.00 eAED:0.02 QI:0/-1/0/1/-1/1/1/0/560
MIDYFVIFSRSGLVLFTYSPHKLGSMAYKPFSADSLGELLTNEDEKSQFALRKGFLNAFKLDSYAFPLVFACFYHKFLNLGYVEELLKQAVEIFKETNGVCWDLDDLKNVQLSEFKAMKKFEKKFMRSLVLLETSDLKKGTLNRSNRAVRGKRDQVREQKEVLESSNEEDEEKLSAFEDRFKIRKPVKRNKTVKKPKSKRKEKRVWDDKKKISREEASDLDIFSKFNSESGSETKKPEIEIESFSESDETEDEDFVESRAGSSLFSGMISKLGFKSGPLTKEDLNFDGLKNQLLSKNVAQNVAEEILSQVEQSLLGKSLNSFERVQSASKEALKQAIKRILTPKKSVDVISAISRKKKEGDVFSIALVGINGTGKSTSLAKLCYLLKSSGFNPLICASDTFRSGAVEQLKVHGRNLGVEVFESGYGKDPASVSYAAKIKAKKSGNDVLLIDTAGRMQNNVKLMREIQKVVDVNNPDLVLFVGEASVGNDGVDQLVEFNKALGGRIDGLIVTKFDTIDEKVGAVVSMVHSAQQPVYFLGTGQKYTNLKKPNVDKILTSLVK